MNRISVLINNKDLTIDISKKYIHIFIYLVLLYIRMLYFNYSIRYF